MAKVGPADMSCQGWQWFCQWALIGFAVIAGISVLLVLALWKRKRGLESERKTAIVGELTACIKRNALPGLVGRSLGTLSDVTTVRSFLLY